jgi:hypothetical protein
MVVVENRFEKSNDVEVEIERGIPDDAMIQESTRAEMILLTLRDANRSDRKIEEECVACCRINEIIRTVYVRVEV